MPIPQNISHYIPEKALPLLSEYWEKYPFQLKINRHRHSKSGDYRFIADRKIHLITVNESLSKYQFLFTLVHEIAHQWVRITSITRKQPHGATWKKMFSTLMQPFLDIDIFPADIKIEILRHLKNPKASTTADQVLFRALQNGNGADLILNDVQEGVEFYIGKKQFKKGPKRRTRYLCHSIPDNKAYTISAIAPIKLGGADPS